MTLSVNQAEALGAPVTADEIPWHSEPFSWQRPDRPYTPGELWTLTEVEVALETLTADQTAAWIVDLIHDREQLKGTLHACMDALHTLHGGKRK